AGPAATRPGPFRPVDHPAQPFLRSIRELNERFHASPSTLHTSSDTSFEHGLRRPTRTSVAAILHHYGPPRVRAGRPRSPLPQPLRVVRCSVEVASGLKALVLPFGAGGRGLGQQPSEFLVPQGLEGARGFERLVE